MNLPQQTDRLTDSDIKTLEQAGIIPAGTPKAQVEVFGQICKERGLSAFSKEIHLVGYGGKYSVIVGINGFRKIANESREHAGTDDVLFDVQPNGGYKTAADIKAAGKVPLTATCTVYRLVSGTRCPFTHTVVFSEFSTGKNKWVEMPFQMIAKVAEAFALRKGFSDRLTGLSIEEEAGAQQGMTIEAAKIHPEIAVDIEALKDEIANRWSDESLLNLYKSNKAYEELAELFTARKTELYELRRSGQIVEGNLPQTAAQ